MPKYRTHLYAVFKSCERFGILPPGVKQRWIDCDNIGKAQLLSYNMIRDIEEAQNGT